MENIRRVRLMAVILAVAIMVSLIVPPSDYGQAQDSRLLVVTSTIIIADVVQNVAGDAAGVVSLMGVGQDPHTFEPSGADVALLDEADIVFINGAEFEEGLLPVLEEAAGDKLHVISDCVPILPLEFALGHGHGHGHDEEDEDEAHPEEPDNDTDQEAMVTWCMTHHADLVDLVGDDDEADEGDEAHHEEHLGLLYQLDCHAIAAEGEDAASCDPHVWNDPRNVMMWTMLARDLLSELDPANSETYAANAGEYLEQLAALDGELAAMFDAIPVEQRIIVTNHGAFGYLAHRYDLEIVGTVIPSGGTAAEPSPNDVVALIETIEDYGVTAIFTEDTVSDTLAGQIADETGVQVLRLYTGSLTDVGGDAPTYIDYMRYNVTTIVEGLTR